MKDLKNVLKMFLCCLLMLLQVSRSRARGQTRIIGGAPTSIDAAPYLVQILKIGFTHCAGALITDRHVLTAAHCVFDIKPSAFEVLAGATDRRQFNKRSWVKKITVPKEFSRRNYNKDVAIIELKTPFEDIKPAKLCSTDWEIGDIVTIFGWGLTSENDTEYPTHLQTTSVQVVNKTGCAKQYLGELNVIDSMACAQAKGKDACVGDSGGPAIMQKKICGVVSIGIGCGRKDYPGIYTQISKVRDFIDSAIKA